MKREDSSFRQNCGMILVTVSLFVTDWKAASLFTLRKNGINSLLNLRLLPRMSKDARIFKRYFFGSASEGSFDKQGRVLVPPSLRKAAGLEKDVVLVGVQDRIEIWDKALWEERSQISEEDLDAIAERMESIGIRI